ncbi:MAG TPA: aldo/keto reductase, partial [Kribbella sp.]|nr:aldo/keto reductase [Kribbella sp.]
VVDRDDVVIATKAGFSVRRGERITDTSRGALLRDLDGSLRRLNTDYLDHWQLHTWSDDVPLEETLSALDHAVSSGKVRYVGVSNYAGWKAARAVTWQQAWPGRAVPVANQVEYSLLARDAEVDAIRAAAGLGIGIIAWSPLGRGVLTGKYRTGIPADSRAASQHLSRFVDPYLDARSSGIVEAVARAADGLGWTPLEVALTWVRDRPGVSAAIVGARTALQLKSVLGVEDLTLPPAIVAALEDVS